jgi:FAD/FMN-containing dehydrogenase
MLPPDYSLQRIIATGEDAQREERHRNIRILGLGDRAFFEADEGWDQARRAWNLSVDQRPSLVVFPETAAEVVALARFAADNGLRLAPQGTGHGAGPLGSLKDTILIRSSRLSGISIDEDRRRARVGAGVVWSDVQAAAGRVGLTGLAGSSPHVGVVGYTLGGGLGWLGRRYGLACNSVVAIEMVTADARLLRVDRDHEPDLFWAMRGGGGSFGVVTAVEFALCPVMQVYAGAMFWPQERAAEILKAWVQWTAGVPDSITSIGRILNLPDAPAIPEKLRGRSVVAVEAACLATEAEGAERLRPLRDLGPEMDTFATILPAELGSLHMDPITPVPTWTDGWLLSDLPPAAADALVEAAGPGSGSPLLSVELRQLGGALAVRSPDHGALDSLDARFAVATINFLRSADAAAAVESQAATVRRALAPWEAEHSYRNFAERARGVSDFHAPETLERLRGVRAKYDPVGVIRSPHPVPTV